MFEPGVRRYLDAARVGRLATADDEGRPHVVPVCFALAEGRVATPIDEKPKRVDPGQLRRVRDVRANPRVALVVDHYTETWANLGWVQLRGTAQVLSPSDPGHDTAVAALRSKYSQYERHALAERPVIEIEPGSVRSWGQFDRDADPTDDGASGSTTR